MSTSLFLILPQEIEFHIFSYLDEETLKQAKRTSKGSRTSIQQFFNACITTLINQNTRLIRDKDPTWQANPDTAPLYALLLPSRAKRSLEESRESHFRKVKDLIRTNELFILWKKYCPEDTDGLRRFQAGLDKEIPVYKGLIGTEINGFIFSLWGDELSIDQKKDQLARLPNVASASGSVFVDGMRVATAIANPRYFQMFIDYSVKEVKQNLFSSQGAFKIQDANNLSLVLEDDDSPRRFDLQDVYLKVGHELNLTTPEVISRIKKDNPKIVSPHSREECLELFNRLYTRDYIVKEAQKHLNNEYKDPIMWDLFTAFLKKRGDTDILDACRSKSFSPLGTELLLKKYCSDRITRRVLCTN